MSEKLGFYELLQPYVAFGMLVENSTGLEINALQKAGSKLSSSFSGPASTLSKIATTILDYLSVEELHTAIDESIIVYSGTAKFGGDGKANPDTPSSSSITSENGQELSWLDDQVSFRMTVPRKGAAVQIDTTGLTGGDLTDMQQLNDLMTQFADTGTPAVSDLPGVDFRLELLLRTVQIKLPRKDFLPAKFSADGWLEPDDDAKDVTFEFPRLAFVLEQKDSAGNLDVTFKSWDAAGFDDPGDKETARLFTVNPPVFLHSSRRVGFGIERVVADFSDDVTPPEILEQFGTGDDFNGFWVPLIRIFVAPGRTTGFAFSARGSDLLFDQDKGFSGEIALDILRRGGKLEVLPVFYSKNSKTPLELKRGDITRHNDGNTTVTQSAVTITGDTELHLSIRGSISPYTASVKLDGNTINADTSAGVNRPVWPIVLTQETGQIEINVADAGNNNHWQEFVQVQKVAGKETAPPDKKFQVFFQLSGGDPGVEIICLNHLSNDQFALIKLSPAQDNAKLLVNGQEMSRNEEGHYKFMLTKDDEPANLVATWPPTTSLATITTTQQQQELVIGTYAAASSVSLKVYFSRAYPLKPDVAPAKVVSDLATKNDTRIGLSTGSFGASLSGINAALNEFLQKTQGRIDIYGFASFEDPRNGNEEGGFDESKNMELSKRRAEVLQGLIKKILGDPPSRNVNIFPYSNIADQEDQTTNSDERFRVAIAVSESKTNDKGRTATVELVEAPSTPSPATVEHPPEASEPERPPIIRKLGLRVRYERNELVLGEFSGELDFIRADEETKGFIKQGDTRNDEGSAETSDVKTAPGASQSGEQGILDFKLTISYDTATRKLTQLLKVGFDQESRDGWVTKESTGVLANTLGSLLIFAPLLNSGIDSAVNAQGDEAVTKAVIAGAEVVTATVIGLTGMVKFKKFTLFGIEVSATELLADDEGTEQTKFGDVSFIFDYAVDFSVNINLGILTIRSKEDPNTGLPIPTRVRYRGFGFRINGQGDPRYESVFDTSKGFELGMAEPGSLVVGGPLGPILRVDSVRVARQNPLVMEMDLGISANLGVISIDTVRVRMPIDPPGAPTIIPTGISVNIPGALEGSGFLDIRDSGFAGALDVTLIPLKLRVQASVGLENLQDGDRRITAFFLGLGIEFPAPIPLANSGLGIYGLLGLFGMHYKRNEDSPVNPGLPVALDWFYNKAKGEPHLLAVDGQRTWVAAPDRWSFGVGMVLGTMEGAFILNLKGMLVLELPGPRILIFVKAQIITVRPPSGKPADQTIGILAVVDLNFQVGYIAIGLIFKYEIKNLLKLEVPIDTQFNFHDVEDWHVYIGSLRSKASAEILGIAKGTAYLMFDGKGIPDFPLGPLNGFSVAAGIAASLVIGDESSGLYAKVSGALDVGVSTAPLHFFGRMTLEGRIHLWFVGLGASAKMDVEAPEPLYVKGEVCGSIDLWLTSISGCVDITIGDPQPLPEPAKLVNGLSLQSHSPALLNGQATDSPVDSSLGVVHEGGELITDVPIDVIPVLQMQYPPVMAAAFTGLQPSSFVPTLPPGSEGWFSMGGVPGNPGEREMKYEVAEITISPAIPGGLTIPVTWWQPARPNASGDSQATDKGVNLALNSWIPVPFPSAYQRSQQQEQTIRDRFEVICQPIAPATSILWTFNAHFTITTNSIIRNPGDPFPGYSPAGWKLNGIAWPDPPGTQRSEFPNLKLYVHEGDYPNRNNQLMLDYASRLTGQILDPAKVIPPSGGVENGQALQFPSLKWMDGLLDGTLAQQLKDITQKFLDTAGNRERILIETGDAALVRALLCTNAEKKVAEFMVLRAFNEKGEIVEEIKMPGQYISSFSQLPPNWQNAAGPWLSDVRRVVTLFTGMFPRTHLMFLMEYKPSKAITRIELLYRHDEPQPNFVLRRPPAAMLGIVETLSKAEMKRVESQQHYQSEMVDVVVKALEEGDKRPLFVPNTLYTVTVKYTGTIRQSTDHSKKKSKDYNQQFKFRTTSHSPKRLNPWVLAMIPENNADGFFTKDKVQFIFNDAAAIQLFKAFGKTLKVKLRKANGNHPPENPVLDLPVLQAVKAKLKNPFAATLEEVVLDMRCIPGITETTQHQVFTVDIPLDRLTSYMLDIESTPPPEDPVTPLYRTAFTTSRYESAQEFAQVVNAANIQEKRLKTALTLTPKPLSFVIPNDTLPEKLETINLNTVSDADMENALLASFGSDIPAARHPGITLLWSSDAPSKKVGLLIDAPEMLLRTMQAPVEVKTPTPDDDAIQHFKMGKQVWMEIKETGSAITESIVYTTGACRSLVLFKNDASGFIKLAFRRYRHILLVDDPLMNDTQFINVKLPDKAPWES